MRKSDSPKSSDPAHPRPGRTRTETVRVTRASIEKVLKNTHRMMIIGHLYRGSIGNQAVTWHEDGSASVSTTHTPAE